MILGYFMCRTGHKLSAISSDYACSHGHIGSEGYGPHVHTSHARICDTRDCTDEMFIDFAPTN